ncbi:hypothetical protein B446_20265 [Streptomyces collinus Tu 365]|uniref:Uncharacterized protein n=1 Tax=Streptomyces collinus (strain DSM 40733 / Tue 365) TaxID=1214242 RepID=S5VSE4_STRC3|nr:hypothetical protein B446_20265 [Streptomyces collinus Tu 365]
MPADPPDGSPDGTPFLGPSGARPSRGAACCVPWRPATGRLSSQAPAAASPYRSPGDPSCRPAPARPCHGVADGAPYRSPDGAPYRPSGEAPYGSPGDRSSHAASDDCSSHGAAGSGCRRPR